MLAFFSEGEASPPAGTLFPSFSLPSNSIPGYLLGVVWFVLVRAWLLWLCCSVVNSAVGFVQHSSLGRRAAVWDEQVLVILHMTPVLSQICLPGACRVLHSLQTVQGAYLGS